MQQILANLSSGWNVSAELHWNVLFTTASAESNCCTNSGDNDSALHGLLSYFVWYQEILRT